MSLLDDFKELIDDLGEDFERFGNELSQIGTEAVAEYKSDPQRYIQESARDLVEMGLNIGFLRKLGDVNADEQQDPADLSRVEPAPDSILHTNETPADANGSTLKRLEFNPMTLRQ